MSVTVDKALGKRFLKNFLPPEGVPIQFAIAALGTRFGAQTLDILITYGTGAVLLLLLAFSDLLAGSALVSFFLLFVFFVRIPYYIFSELVWNGRTLGKRITGIRVISADGAGLTPYQVTARNLMKEVEVFMPATLLFGAGDFSGWERLAALAWSLSVLSVPFLNRRRQRLGDMIAGTLVVEQPRAVLLPDLTDSAAGAAAQFVFDAEQLAVYGRYELQTLEAILRDPPKSPQARRHVSEVAQTIRRKIGGLDSLPAGAEWDFLLEFYRQQRAFLESRHLLGDSRENKHHAAAPKPPGQGAA
ncbi:RDD family protein [Leisingera thetidis]|uniref:RDD family protein n=1 Tax=Leisingera thetidis TaxID=2930199 RepID=UPI0021F75A77|nr:RDD family protein [Leisingera thetidis]